MTFNKTLANLLGGAVVVLSLNACTDLTTVVNDSEVLEVSDEGFVAGDPAELLAAAYSTMDNLTDQANIYSLFNHTSDEMIPPTRGIDWGDNGVWRTLHSHNWDPTHAYVLGSWNQIHERIFRLNIALASNPSPEQAAEAKVLRGYLLWMALDLWGQVPFREVTDGVDVDPKVLTRSEAFDLVVNDVESAIADLPSIGPDPTNSRASKAAAHALLARLYLNKAVYKAESPAGPYNFDAADMTKVVENCEAVEAEGFSLEDNYFQIFSVNAANEIILVTETGSPQNRYRMTLHYDQNPDGWNGFATLADFYDKFEEGDTRRGIAATPDGTEFSGLGRGFLLGQQLNDAGEEIINSRNQLPLAFTREVPLLGAGTEEGIRVVKYHPADQGQYILLRYGDVHLMKAEAVLRGGSDDQSALDIVNELRAARGASALGSIDEAGMLDERGRELYWEGIRRVDQIRFGTFNGTWSDKTNTEDFRVLFPIPQRAMDTNPNLVQNDGY